MLVSSCTIPLDFSYLGLSFPIANIPPLFQDSFFSLEEASFRKDQNRVIKLCLYSANSLFLLLWRIWFQFSAASFTPFGYSFLDSETVSPGILSPSMHTLFSFLDKTSLLVKIRFFLQGVPLVSDFFFFFPWCGVFLLFFCGVWCVGVVLLFLFFFFFVFGWGGELGLDVSSESTFPHSFFSLFPLSIISFFPGPGKFPRKWSIEFRSLVLPVAPAKLD